MLLDQVYANATNSFQNDPELRNLLLQTMNQAEGSGLPAIYSPPPAAAATSQFTPEQIALIQQQQSNAAAKADKLPVGNPLDRPIPVKTSTIPVPGIVPSPASEPASSGPPVQPTPNAPANRPAMPNAPARAAMPATAPVRTAAASPPVAGPTGGQQIAAFLAGLGSSDAILPAIGGGMQAVQNLETQNRNRNQTVRALMNRGLDADTAAAAASNPEILKTVLPTLFGSKREMGEIYDEQGRQQKVFYDSQGNITPIGGPKADTTQNAVTSAQGKANIKRVELLKNQADGAREMLGTINQIKALREGVPDALKGLPGGMGSTIAGWTDYFGVTQGARALNPQELNVQLGFTERTKGAITDREMALFAGGTPGFGMTDAAAAKTMTGMEAAAQRKIEQAKFFEAYMAANQNSLEGAQDAWDAYITANPIITRNPDGTLSVNTQNVGNWRDYVGGSGQPRAVQPGPSGGDVNVQSGPNNNLPGAGGTSGFSGNVRQPAARDAYSARPHSQAGGQLPVVNTQEEYDALPSGVGAKFIDIDEATGKRTVYTKP